MSVVWIYITNKDADTISMEKQESSCYKHFRKTLVTSLPKLKFT